MDSQLSQQSSICGKDDSFFNELPSSLLLKIHNFGLLESLFYPIYQVDYLYTKLSWILQLHTKAEIRYCWFSNFFFLVIVVYFFLDSCIFTYTSELAYKFINTKCFLGFWFRSHLIYRSILRDLVLFLCEHHETLELSRSLIQQCLLVFCFIPDLRGEGFSISSSNTGISCFVTLHFIAFFYNLKVCVKQVSRCHFSKHISHFVFL